MMIWTVSFLVRGRVRRDVGLFFIRRPGRRRCLDSYTSDECVQELGFMTE